MYVYFCVLGRVVAVGLWVCGRGRGLFVGRMGGGRERGGVGISFISFHSCLFIEYIRQCLLWPLLVVFFTPLAIDVAEIAVPSCTDTHTHTRISARPFLLFSSPHRQKTEK